MPFYEYECPACKYYAEVLQKISDKPLAKCPSCGKKGFKRLISAPVFRLKGSGWYETDFKSGKDSQRNLAGAEREEAKPAADEKGGEKPGEKPGEKAETKPAADAPDTAKPKADAVATKGEPGARRDAKRSTRPAAKPMPKAAAKRRAGSALRRGSRPGRRR